jgi:LPS sulfotransferase NodH
MQSLLSHAFHHGRGQDHHERAIRAHFGAALLAGADGVEDKGGEAPETLFILFTNRSGSNLLAELLAAGGRVNPAEEELNQNLVIARSRAAGHATFEAYLRACRDRQVGGRFAIKAALPQYDFLARAGLLDRVFPRRRLLVTERRDKIAQAVSWVIASQTLAYRSGDPARAEACYDAEAIRSFAHHAATLHHDLPFYLALRGEPWCQVIYEELVGERPATLARVASFLGWPPIAVEESHLTLRRQSGPLNAAFRERFLAEARVSEGFVWPGVETAPKLAR